METKVIVYINHIFLYNFVLSMSENQHCSEESKPLKKHIITGNFTYIIKINFLKIKLKFHKKTVMQNKTVFKIILTTAECFHVFF